MFKGTSSINSHQLKRCFCVPHHSGVIDLADVQFVNPAGLVAVAVVAQRLADRRTFERLILPGDQNARRYLDRMGLPAVISEVTGIEVPSEDVTHHDRRTQLLELQRAQSFAEWTDLGDLIHRRLDGEVAAQTSATVHEGLEELRDNVYSHSGSEAVFVAAQTYERGTPSERIDIALGDAGIGIPEALRRGQLPFRDDPDAVSLSLKAGVTATGDPGRGVGLTQTVEATTILGGEATVFSAGAMVTCLSDGNRGMLKTPERFPGFPGTMVVLSIPCHPGAVS